MNDITFFNFIYYGILVIYIIFGLVAVMVATTRSHFRPDVSKDKLRIMQKNSKKHLIIYFIASYLVLALLIPLYIFSPKLILAIQFVILFFSINFSLLFTYNLMYYLAIRKKLKLIDNAES